LKSEIESLLQKTFNKISFDVSVLLSENDKNINNLKINFLKLENDLGVSGEVAMADFKTSAKTFTSNHQTNNRFEIKKLTQILEANKLRLLKVKSVISRPEFAYETSTDIAVYREKVYEWCKILAEENLGNIGYPKQYGGGGTIQDYFAVMETLTTT
jgi:acyl-CoA oxidase